MRDEITKGGVSAERLRVGEFAKHWIESKARPSIPGPLSDTPRLSTITSSLGLQVDFLGTIHGVRSFESLRSRAVLVKLGDVDLAVASLEDIVRSKRAAGRPKDYAVLHTLEVTLDEAQGKADARRPARRPRTRV